MDTTNPCTDIRWGFSGELSEMACELYVLGNRVYCPALRRFLSADMSSPMSDGGIHRYGYCGGDPIQRIDPGGASWLDWLGSAAGLVGAIVGTAFSVAALVATAGAAAPASFALIAAAALDVASLVAEVGSLAALAAGEPTMAQTFGWVAFGTGGASAVGGAIAMRTARSVSELRKGAESQSILRSGGAGGRARQPLWPFGRKVGTREIRAVRDADASRIAFQWGEPRVSPKWHRFARAGRHREAVHFGADTKVIGFDTYDVVARATREASESVPVYIYSGVHGSANGQNWSGVARGMVDRTMYDSDLIERASYQLTAAKSQSVSVLNLGDMTPTEAASAWSRPGIHIHAYCYGAVDELLLQLMNRSAVPVYV